MEHIGVYLRISADPDGTQTATDRQRKDCIAYAKRQGWKVADVFEDTDLSAFKKRVIRPQFERMLEAVRTKAITGVLAWKMDRITRRQRDLVRLDEASEEAGGFIASVVEGINTREPAGRFVAELLVSQARMESENSSIRIRRQAQEQADKGKPSLGGCRPFGYSDDRTKVIPAEAKLIREAAKRIIAGESVRSLAFDWSKRGVTTTTGRPFSRTTLVQMLKSPGLAAQRRVGGKDGKLVPGVWKPIITPEEHQRLLAILNGDGHHKRRSSVRSYVLTGLVRCGNCGEVLTPRRKSDGKRAYLCIREPESGHCGKVSRLAEPVEALVKDKLIAALDGVDVKQYIEQSHGTDDAVLRDSIRADEQALAELAKDFYTDRRISRTEFFAARDSIDARLQASKKELGRTNGKGILNNIAGAGATVRKQWDARDLDWRRTIVAAAIDRVVIKPVGKGNKAFDPKAVKIVWKF